jgi:hypothetical protein
VSNDNANWIFDVAYNTTTNQNEILAHVAFPLTPMARCTEATTTARLRLILYRR